MNDQTPKETLITLRQEKAFSDSLTELARAASAQNIPDQQVWLSMWTSVANSFNCRDAATAASWADKGLRQFRERFPALPPNTE